MFCLSAYNMASRNYIFAVEDASNKAGPLPASDMLHRALNSLQDYNVNQALSNLEVEFQNNDYQPPFNEVPIINNNGNSDVTATGVAVEVVFNRPEEEELHQLLKRFNQSELFEVLVAQGVFVNVLKVIKPHHIGKLLENFSLGTQVIFEHNIDMWRNAMDLGSSQLDNNQNNNDSLKRVNLLSTSSYPNSPSSSTVESCPESPSDAYTSLATILKDSCNGIAICDYYKRHTKFNEEQRSALINLIANFYERNDKHLSLKTSHQLETEILTIFPTEKLEYYRTSNRGKLYNRASNTKKVFKSKFSTHQSAIPAKKSKTSGSNMCTKEFVPEEAAENCYNSLKFDNLSSEEFDNVWKACANFRINELKKLESTSAILERWPYYKRPSGYRLIDMDFRLMFDSGNLFLDKWEEDVNKLLTILKREVKDKYVKGVISLLKNDAVPEKCRDAVILWSLHAYLCPTKKVVKKDINGKKNTIKFTIKDSQDSFVFVGKSHQELEDHLLHLKQLKNNIQPFILVVGENINNFKEMYVYFDDLRYTFTSFLRAVDICFKIFFVFNLDFPVECSTFWSFVGHYFYEIESVNCTSKIHVLSEEMRTVKSGE
ncbi:uncharacterized protein LOC116168916 [Photinus pyralis]|uniref:uncharacterized protein LOC116168916 n=1 Tax=Photinus pyralis TaxID=7054 RepID=UPI001266EC6A|nr:uncharacterized protein LOC116168916 [Photinus pyralis]